MEMEKHGTLVTVASLLFVIVYSTENYDSWDIIVSAIAAAFGILFLINSDEKDNFELLLGSLISCGGSLICATSVWAVVRFYLTNKVLPLANIDGEPVSLLFVLIVTSALLVFVIYRIKGVK